MSVEFRQRTAGEFIKMLKRRKWFIFLPIITMTAAIGYVVYKLPSVYESKTLLTVKPPVIPNEVVPALSAEDLSQRLQTINQEVLSRSSLEPMIIKYDLFKFERNSGMDTAMIVDKMRKNIVVEVEESDDKKLAAFKISYRDREPNATRNVTAELAAKYVNAQVLQSTQTAEKTSEFIEKELKEKKEILDNLAKQRLEIMMQNVETLPESQQGLIAQLDGLRKREETLAKEKETLITEKGRLSEGIRSYNSQIRLIEDYGQKDAENNASRNDYKKTQAYGEMLKKKTELAAKFENIKKKFRPAHPEYIAVQTEIEKVNDQLAAMEKDAKEISQESRQWTKEKAGYQIKQIEIEKGKLENQTSLIDQQINFKEQELSQNTIQINALEAKINSIPNVKVALEGIETQYQSAKQTYDDLLKKSNDASLRVNVASNAQGETIRVQDPANLPESPVAPKRGMLTLLGAGIGLAIGLFLAVAFELPRILKIQNIEDAKHYTGLPILASVPPLLSHDEKVWLKRSHWLRVMAGIILAVGAIPLIALILQATKIFDRMVS